MRSEISVHEIRIYRVLQRHHARWLTSKDVALEAAVAPRTARSHLHRLVCLGMVEQSEVFPGFRYRLTEKARGGSLGYVQRLEAASEVFAELLSEEQAS